MGTALHHMFSTYFTKKPFLTLKKNDIYKICLEKLCSITLFVIPRYTYVPNMGTLSQTMPREWSYLGCLSWKLYMFIDDRTYCDGFFCKICQKSSLSFLLANTTHKRTPCQRICFSDVFFIFLEFFQKNVKMTSTAVRWKGSNFSKLSKVLWNNQ